MTGKKIVATDESVAAAAPAKKKGGLKKLLLLVGGGMLLAGGGAGAGLYAAGMLPGGAHGVPEDPNQPRLVLKDGETEYPQAAAKAPDPRKYKASYLPIEDSFTSNLRDTDGFMQASIGVSTFYDQRVLDRVKEHEMPIRSAVLLTLADQDSAVIGTPQGKKALQKDLAVAINKVLEAKEGFGGIDDVYFTNFIIQ